MHFKAFSREFWIKLLSIKKERLAGYLAFIVGIVVIRDGRENMSCVPDNFILYMPAIAGVALTFLQRETAWIAFYMFLGAFTMRIANDYSTRTAGRDIWDITGYLILAIYIALIAVIFSMATLGIIKLYKKIISR